ncbi:hypothetical protein AQJ91_04080 [Streptomyces dysideae]|uniref:Protein kinase domain-containing protein n=1 Tax=Streptomyces dysideae TaxID=909626 RepID=A0A101V4U2_9ACTN|nr:hypothetical protein AQJ91_04080 [Streptomyces dysideae]
MLAPAPPMLSHPLALQRALRPLKRTVPSPRARVLDEHATADRIARLGAHPDLWVPVLGPAPDRWLRLNLVYDTGPTMPVWRPLVRELHTTLAQSGIFRTVTLHQATPNGRARHVPVLADGRTVTLVVSDCMGPQWRPGPAGVRWYRTLRRWAARMPLAVVQPLPEHLWHTTALPAEAGLLTAPSAAAPAVALSFRPYAPDAPPAPRAAVPLPVLEPAPAWLANWAGLIAAPDGGRAPGALAWLPPTPVPPAEQTPDVGSLTPEELVLRFRATASPEAFRLAGHLALAVPSLPVMRLVQRALEPAPRPQHLAEIILSGMLTAVSGPPGSYAFRPGVRELLLRSLPRTARTRTREFLARVGGLIDERAGLAAGEFRAEARGDEGTAFATVAEETVRRLGGGGSEAGLIGGRYRLVGQRGPSQRMWAAVDVRTGESVVVHRYPRQAAPQERFLREARALAGLRHPNVVRVPAYGVDAERPYLVAEFTDGVTLAELELGSGPGVSFSVFARLVRDVPPGLAALHERGLVRGQAGWDGLLLKPDGTVVISRFALGEQSPGHDATSDFREFNSLLRQMARQVAAPPMFRGLLGQIADGDLTGAAALGAASLHGTRFGLLGPLRIERDSGQTLPPSPEAQALLCMLLLEQGRRVTNAELSDGLWEQPLPDHEARERMSPLADELRRLLGRGTLAALADGLALHAPDDHIDVLHCEELLARRAHDQDPGTQRALIQQALDLWYGDPLDGIPGPAAKATRARLRTLRLTLCVSRAELDLELGHFAQAAADLTGLIGDHPDREDFRRLHMLALKGVGRIAEAVEAYEAYEEYRQRQYGDPIGPALRELYRELRTAHGQRQRPVIVFGADGLSGHPQARAAVERLVSWVPDLLSASPEVRSWDDAYVVVLDDEADVLPALAAVARSLPEFLVGVEDPPRVWAAFWHTSWWPDSDESAMPPDVRAVLERDAADIAVVVSTTLLEGFARSSAERVGLRFEPLRPDPAAAPIAWSCILSRATPEPRDLVRGPFTVPNLDHLAPTDPFRTAIVRARQDDPHLVTYYEVDLTPHQTGTTLVLPGSRGGAFTATAELSWHVDNPVAFVDGGTTHIADALLQHLAKEAARITRRYPVRRVGAAQHALFDGLREWPVPGLSVSCSVLLTPQEEPAPRHDPTTSSPLHPLLAEAEAVLLGFDGTLTHLFPRKAARDAALDLLSLVVENRDPADALEGRLLTGPFAAMEQFVHPLDVLRAFAHNRLGPVLRTRLDELELRAAAGAVPGSNTTALVRALRAGGRRRVTVITDCCEQAVHRYLERIELPLQGVHGRTEDLGLLMPHPDCLLRALHTLGVPAPTGLVIGSSVAELDAAQRLGLRFVGIAPTPDAERQLREAGCEVTVPSPQPLIEAALTL